MEYRCVDRGTKRCPCNLMAAGQCYICTMSRTGKCECGEKWQGMCPYNEFLQRGGKPVVLEWDMVASVTQIDEYSEQLKVVRLQVPAGFAQQCRTAGSYVMVSSLGYKVPLSVLRSEVWGDEGRNGFIELAIQPAGPKTLELFRPGETEWKISGPFAAGLTNVEKLDFGKQTLVIGKGTALAPYINIMDALDAQVYVDCDKLAADFVEKYLGDKVAGCVSMQQDLETLLPLIDAADQVMFLASPYYTEKILEMRPERKGDIITANHANICCGVGICGACSYTDKDGVTVRRCKVTER